MSAKKPEEKSEEKPNLRVWDKLQETDPNYTKGFDRGGYKGTSINPTYCYKKLTDTFGPAGIGWYFDVVKSETVEGKNGELLLFKEVHLFVKNDGEWSKPIVGQGGDFIIAVYKSGTPQQYSKCDDESHKKAVTDALTNAMKMLGMSADVHMGEYDDNKYLNDLKKKYADEPEKKKETPKPDQPKAATADEVKMVLEAFKEAKNAEEFHEAKKTKLEPLWARMEKADKEKVSKAIKDRAVELKIPEKKTESVSDAKKPINGAGVKSTIQQKLDRAENLMGAA